MKGCGITLTIGALALSAAGAQCVPYPTSAFAGQVKIAYPRAGGNASVTQRCDANAVKIKRDLITQARKAGINITWAEVYLVKSWASTFQSGIYQLRDKGFAQVSFKKFSVPGWENGEQLVYGNKAGKFAGMTSQPVSSDRNATLFVLYGN